MSSQDWEGKTVVVTGASSGIGEVLSNAIGSAGATVVLIARSKEKLENLAKKLGPKAEACALDVSDREAVQAVFERILRKHGSIDMLINNAGFGAFQAVADSSAETLRRMMDVNYFGMVHCTQAVLPSMLERGSGHIVNVASIAGKFATAKSAGYSASKHAVLGFSNALRQELHGTGVYVTAVNPGPVRTAFFDLADPEGSYVKNVQWMMVEPDQVVRAVLRGIRKRKAEVNVPRWLGAAAAFGQVMPSGLVQRVASRFLNLK